MSKIAAIDFANYVEEQRQLLKSGLQVSGRALIGSSLRTLAAQAVSELPIPAPTPVPDPEYPTADPELEYLKTYYANDPDTQTHNYVNYILCTVTTPISSTWTWSAYNLVVGSTFTIKNGEYLKEFTVSSNGAVSGQIGGNQEHFWDTTTINGKEYLFIRFYGHQVCADFEDWEQTYAQGYPAADTLSNPIRAGLQFNSNSSNIQQEYMLLKGVGNIAVSETYDSYCCKQYYFTTDSAITAENSGNYLRFNDVLRRTNLIECEDDCFKIMANRYQAMRSPGSYYIYPFYSECDVLGVPSKYCFYGDMRFSMSKFPKVTNLRFKTSTLVQCWSIVHPSNATSYDAFYRYSNIPINKLCILNAITSTASSVSMPILGGKSGPKELVITTLNVSATSIINFNTNSDSSYDNIDTTTILSIVPLVTNGTVYVRHTLKELNLPVGFSTQKFYLNNCSPAFSLQSILKILNSLSSTTTYSSTRYVYLNSMQRRLASNFYIKLDDNKYIETTSDDPDAITLLEGFTSKNWTVSITNPNS